MLIDIQYTIRGVQFVIATTLGVTTNANEPIGIADKAQIIRIFFRLYWFSNCLGCCDNLNSLMLLVSSTNLILYAFHQSFIDALRMELLPNLILKFELPFTTKLPFKHQIPPFG